MYFFAVYLPGLMSEIFEGYVNLGRKERKRYWINTFMGNGKEELLGHPIRF